MKNAELSAHAHLQTRQVQGHGPDAWLFDQLSAGTGQLFELTMNIQHGA